MLLLIDVVVETVLSKIRERLNEGCRKSNDGHSKQTMGKTQANGAVGGQLEDESDIEQKYAKFFQINTDGLVKRNDGWRTRSDMINRDKELTQLIYAEDATMVRCQPLGSRNKHNGFRLPKYDVPKAVINALYEDKKPETAYPYISKPLDPQIYDHKFHYLLYFEEAAMYLSMRNFDLDRRRLNKCGDFMSLEIPREVLTRSALIKGNRVLLTHPTKRPIVSFEGFIHKIEQNYILMRFHEKFHEMYDGTEYNVSFHFGRTNFRQCHYAIDQVFSHACYELLFPSEKRNLSSKEKYLWKGNAKKMKYFNIDLNRTQKNAVIGVLRSSQRPSPYIIVGPPATGKTTTVVESILQIVVKLRKSRILVCTNSNILADEIALKLLESRIIYEDKLTRLVSVNYARNVNENLKSVSVIFTDDPHDNDWFYRKVIVTTCNNAGNLYCMLKNSMHFTHCIIDDSTKTSEPEALVAIGLVAAACGVVVLTGDPSQIRPNCESPISRYNGLSDPLMLRLMQYTPYLTSEKFKKFGGYNPYYITKLDVAYDGEK
ncbi:uncharacterized protein B4U80_13008 [Leptotrombidium deliense]|uniref:Uncharacterized protein n=1 Tax=Leptotrombidium deliense TaxID=299467 RepID=A0A443SF22_9ACAR|nr:uncharacterized protein B4U80_13008 [Leptotrombidium deliense]